METAFKIDCVISKSSDSHKQAFGRRQLVNYYGRDIYVISLEDLILSKLLWAAKSDSEKQLTDIENLMRNEFDHEYIELWAEELGVATRYRNFLKK